MLSHTNPWQPPFRVRDMNAQILQSTVCTHWSILDTPVSDKNVDTSTNHGASNGDYRRLLTQKIKQIRLAAQISLLCHT
jgi:hypothetical protein